MRSAPCVSAIQDVRHSVAMSSTASLHLPTRCAPTHSPGRPTTATACCATSKSTPRSSRTSPVLPRMARPCTRSSTVQGGPGSNAVTRRHCCASPPSRPTGPRSASRRCSPTASTSRSPATTTRNSGTSRRRSSAAGAVRGFGGRASRQRRRGVRALHRRRLAGLAMDRVRVVHQLARTRPLGATSRQPGHLSGGADPRARRRPRLDHVVGGVTDRRRSVPELDVRPSRQHRSRHCAHRLFAVRVRHRRRVRSHRISGRHELRVAIPRSAHDRRVPAAPPRRRPAVRW